MNRGRKCGAEFRRANPVPVATGISEPRLSVLAVTVGSITDKSQRFSDCKMLISEKFNGECGT